MMVLAVWESRSQQECKYSTFSAESEVFSEHFDLEVDMSRAKERKYKLSYTGSASA
jgi:hypothetical protein